MDGKLHMLHSGCHGVCMYALLLGCARKALILAGECMGGGGCDVMVYVCTAFGCVHARHQLCG